MKNRFSFRSLFRSLTPLLGGLVLLPLWAAPKASAWDDPGIAALQTLRWGTLHAQQGDDRQMLEAARRSEQQVSLRENQLAISLAYAELGQFAEAESWLQKTASTEPFFDTLESQMAYVKGRMLMLKGNYPAAREALQQAAADPALLARLDALEAGELGHCSLPLPRLQKLSLDQLSGCLALPLADPSLLRVIYEIGERRSASYVTRLLPFLHNPPTRLAALEALGKIALPQQLNLVVRPYLNDSNLEVRRAAYSALRQLMRRHPFDAKTRAEWAKTLIAASRNQQQDGRAWLEIIDTLGALRSPQALPFLNELAKIAKAGGEGAEVKILEGWWTEVIEFSWLISEAVPKARAEIKAHS